jgi:hypothetical protein
MRFVSVLTGARRVALLCALSAVALAVSTAPASAAEEGFGINRFEAGTCTENGLAPEEACTYATPPKFYTLAAGHPPFGITEFEFDSFEIETAGEKAKVPKGRVKNIRTDLPVGLSVNPEAEPQCTMEEFGEVEVPPSSGSGVFLEPECKKETELGTNVLVVTLEVAPGVVRNVPLIGTAYNLVPAEGLPLEIGIAVEITAIVEGEEKTKLPFKVYAHTLLEGGVSWHSGETYANGEPVPHSGNYHEYFKITEVSEELPLLSSRLIFEGTAGTGFLTMPSSCGPATTDLWVESHTGEVASAETTPAEPFEVVPVSECDKVPFAPEIDVKPSTTKADAADGATVEVLVPQNEDSAKIDSSTLSSAEVTLPPGMTINPAAAVGLEACTDKQFGKGTAAPIACPPNSKIGTVAIEVPTLPAGALTGDVYVGQPVPGKSAASGEEYRIFINAGSERYNVDVRLEGEVKANEATGQLTTLVTENPPLPFSDFVVHLEEGKHTPLANPISCVAANTTATFVPYSAPASATAGLLKEPFTPIECAKFAPTQATSSSSSQAASATSFSFTLTRPEAQPYVSTVSTTLPPGLIGKIPSVPLCQEPQAGKGECPASSAIGTVSVELGSGSPTLKLSGVVYLTGPYEGAPYGMTIVVPATSVGPYDYGNIITRAKIEVNPSTAQVTIASQLPTIVGGVPIRMRALNVTINRPNFLINPTSCAPLATSSVLTSTLSDTATASSPFQATGCSSLKFEPGFKAATSGKPSRKNGASLSTTLTMPAGNANVKSVSVTLPKKLPSRSSTLKEACVLTTFEANPETCPAGSVVGEATAVTPALPDTMKGTAYYVSLGHAGFPNLDVVLEGDGVTVILVGQTNIKNHITHTNFLTLPDVPVTQFTLNLPMGEKSALSANGSLCKKPLFLPTSIVAQNGATFSQKTKIEVSQCPIVVLQHEVKKGKKLQIKLRTPGAGKIVVTGADLLTKKKLAGKAKVVTISEKLTAKGEAKLSRKHKLTVKANIKFTPAKGKASKASVKAKLKDRH